MSKKLEITPPPATGNRVAEGEGVEKIVKNDKLGGGVSFSVKRK